MTYRTFGAKASQTIATPLISLVEDDAAVRYSLGNLLNSAGLTVERFASAEEFLSSAPAGTRSCLILDVKLPQMSGIELQQLLLNRSDPVPIIFITANTADNLRIQALRNGALAYFYKPFDSGILLKVVRAAATRSERLVANFQ